MKTDIRYALSALVLCIGAFLTPATAFAAGGADTTPPRVSAKAADGMLHIEATDDDSGVEAIYISGKRVNYRVDGALDLDFEDFAPDGQETVEVYGIDFAGNQSETVEVKNPRYQAPEPEPEQRPFTPDGQASVLDHATEEEGNGDDLNISLKTILNDAYCHDISVKTRSALLTKRKNGDFVGACPIYGYQKSKENHNQLAIDSFAAKVVQDIFRKKIDGYSAAKIAESLNQSGILSPLAYKENRGLPHPSGGFADKEKAKWSATTIIRILKDETYTGTLVQGRQTTYNHKVKDLVEKPSEEWIRTENAHEPIIRRQDYDLVQKIMGLDTRTAPNGKKVYLFSGILICGSCGARMTRKTVPYKDSKYFYYYCPTGKKNGCAHPVMLREQDLTDCITESLKAHIGNVVSLEELLRDISEEQVNQELIAEYKAQLMENEEQLASLTRFQSTLYENFVTGLLNKDDYKSLKNSYHADIRRLKEAAAKLREEMDAVKGSSHDRLRWIQHFKRFSGMEKIDRRAVIALIQSIRVLEKDDLQITFRYQMEYQAIMDRLSAHAAPMPGQDDNGVGTERVSFTSASLSGQDTKGKEAV